MASEKSGRSKRKAVAPTVARSGHELGEAAGSGHRVQGVRLVEVSDRKLVVGERAGITRVQLMRHQAARLVVHHLFHGSCGAQAGKAF